MVQPKVRNALDQARFFFTRKGKKTIFIEGVKDYKMLSPLVNDDIRLEVLDGKPNVIYVGGKYRQDNFAIQNKYVMIMADVDYDVVINKSLSINVEYNVYCKENGFFYNDLELFLINTNALKKLLINHNVNFTTEEFEIFKDSIEKTSRFFGKYRAADEFLKHTLGGNSVLNSLSIDDYLIPNAMTIDVDGDAFLEQLPRWSNRKELIDDLLSEAERLDSEYSGKWDLSNGHDVTKMITAYIQEKESVKRGRKITLRHEDIELVLRVACDSSDYRNSPMGAALSLFGAI